MRVGKIYLGSPREEQRLYATVRARVISRKPSRLKINFRTSLSAKNSCEAHRMEFRDKYEAGLYEGFLTVTTRGSFTNRVKVF